MGLTFDQFWTTQRDRIARALALTIGDADLATDAVDEAMARAYQRWQRVGTLQHPGGWVVPRGAQLDTVAAPPATPHAPGVAHVGGRHRGRLRPRPEHRPGGAALPETQRAVVVCRLLLGWSEAQTAAALDVRPGTVKSRLSRALDDLALALHHLDPSEEPR